MSTYKGNEGNLLQHWTLCELAAAARNHCRSLLYIDAHTMAPAAYNRTVKSAKFDTVSGCLPGQRSEYELAWKDLAKSPGVYPNSANFVVRIMRPEGIASMLLCERDGPTLDLLRQWAKELNTIEIEIAEGDWRERFRRGLPPQQGLTLVSFDPYMFNRRNRECRKLGKMYPDDLDILAEATQIYRENIIVQLSTYSANDDNSQKDVIECVCSRLAQEDFEKAAIVKLNGNMMSLVFQRGVEFAGELGKLPGRFRKWFRRGGGDW